MKRITLDSRARRRGVDELEIEMRIVPHQYRLVAAMLPDRVAHRFENFRQGLFFVQRQAKRMVDVDAVDFHRLRIEVGALEWIDVAGNGFRAVKLSSFVHVDQYRGHLQQRVGDFVESPG